MGVIMVLKQIWNNFMELGYPWVLCLSRGFVYSHALFSSLYVFTDLSVTLDLGGRCFVFGKSILFVQLFKMKKGMFFFFFGLFCF